MLPAQPRGNRLFDLYNEWETRQRRLIGDYPGSPKRRRHAQPARPAGAIGLFLTPLVLEDELADLIAKLIFRAVERLAQTQGLPVRHNASSIVEYDELRDVETCPVRLGRGPPPLASLRHEHGHAVPHI
jgi:hypothetical protein